MKNHSVCTFPSGKRYNADLNATYNIAAKGILKLCTFPGNRKDGDRQQTSAGRVCSRPGLRDGIMSIRSDGNRIVPKETGSCFLP